MQFLADCEIYKTLYLFDILYSLAVIFGASGGPIGNYDLPGTVASFLTCFIEDVLTLVVLV